MCENCPTRGTICPNCGDDPCSHQCHNSVAYYSPEQERYDDQFYGEDDNRERYAGELIGLGDDDADTSFPWVPMTAPLRPIIDTDDIPF